MTTQAELLAQAQREADDLVAEVAAIRAAHDAEDYDASDELTEDLWSRPLCAERMVTWRVTLGTGGPAYGVDFVLDDGELSHATVWWQDWFTDREHVELDDETAEYLFAAWIAE